jgi:hypothetical protein
MNTHRRKSVSTTFQLETLDNRIAPATFGFAAAAHAAVVHHHAVHHHALHPQVAAPHHARHHVAHLVSAQMTVAGSFHAAGGMMPAAHPRHIRSAAGSMMLAAQPSLISVGMRPFAPVGLTPTLAPTPSPAPAPAAGSTVTNLPPKVDSNLNTIYQEFESSGGSGNFTSPLASYIKIEGSNVGVDVHGNGSGDFATLVAELQGLGMQVTASDAMTQTVEGLLPIGQLPAAATEPGTLSISAQYLPLMA